MIKDMQQRDTIAVVMFSVLLTGIMAFFWLGHSRIFGVQSDVIVLFDRQVAQGSVQHATGNIALIISDFARQDDVVSKEYDVFTKRIEDADALHIATYSYSAIEALKDHRSFLGKAFDRVSVFYPSDSGISLQTVSKPYTVLRWRLVVGESAVAIAVGIIIFFLLRMWCLRMCLSLPHHSFFSGRNTKRWQKSHETQKTLRTENRMTPFSGSIVTKRQHLEKEDMQQDENREKNRVFTPVLPSFDDAYTWSDVRNELAHDDGNDTTGKSERAHLEQGNHEVIADSQKSKDMLQDNHAREERPRETQRTEEHTDDDTELAGKEKNQQPTKQIGAPGNLPVIEDTFIAQKDMEVQEDAEDEKQSIDDLSDAFDLGEPSDEELKKRLNQLLQGNL